MKRCCFAQSSLFQKHHCFKKTCQYLTFIFDIIIRFINFFSNAADTGMNAPKKRASLAVLRHILHGDAFSSHRCHVKMTYIFLSYSDAFDSSSSGVKPWYFETLENQWKSIPLVMYSLLNMISHRKERVDEMFCSLTDLLHHAGHCDRHGPQNFRLNHPSPIVGNRINSVDYTAVLSVMQLFAMVTMHGFERNAAAHTCSRVV